MQRKMFYRYDEFLNYLDICIGNMKYRPCSIFVIMRDGYTKNGLVASKYRIERLDYNIKYDDYEWDNDWFEGQSFIDIYAILTDDDILSAFGCQNKDGE